MTATVPDADDGAREDLPAPEETKPPGVPVTIDGREVSAQPGELVIAAAERSGIYIPRFCWHPRMEPVGMCRMCLVEVETPRGPALVASCVTPVMEGQKVSTQHTSEAARAAQEDVLEFLLINHPLDCPVCDKGGECPLQDQTLAHGPGETRFVEEKRHWAKPIELSSLVLLDRERCIQCARCTRFADEIAGDPQIDLISRGDHLEVATFPGRPFTSYFSGNTVQICPVGALTATPYRFRARPWDLDQTETTCTACAVGCRMAVQSADNRLVRNLGLGGEVIQAPSSTPFSHPVNEGWLCDKGRFGFEATDSPERFDTPLIAGAPASWGDALDRVSSAISEAIRLHGPESVAVIGGARLANEDAYAWARLAKGVIGTDSVDAQLGDGLPAELVLGLPRATVDEACNAGAVVLMAPDLKEELPVLYLRLRAAAQAGTPIIEIGTAPTGLTTHAVASVRHRPGDSGSIVDEAVRLATDAAKGGPVVVVGGRANLAESEATQAATILRLMSGVAGAKFLPALRRANVMGALEAGLAPGVLPGGAALAEGREWYAEGWGRVPSAKGRDCTAILRDAAEGRIHVLVLLGADPATDFPDRDLARRALGATPMIVSVATVTDSTTPSAHVVLPAAGWAERPGTTTNIEGRVTPLGQKLTPRGIAWADWIIAGELARRLGSDPGWASSDDVASEREFRVSNEAAPQRLGVPADVQSPTAPDDAYSLRLVVTRKLYDRGTTVRHSSSLAPLTPTAQLRVHPADLERAGIAGGGLGRLRSARTTFQVETVSDPGLARGSAHLYFNIADAGEDAADLIDAETPVVEVRLESNS
ncbi:MAG TPA: NADH-quinone oxidoreductase subunit NuoG [Acidimicrobiales bacterium]|nr:NADH-quinone oxidoreductase subunit NuoG [Acidimicrobiales bacterium]